MGPAMGKRAENVTYCHLWGCHGTVLLLYYKLQSAQVYKRRRQGRTHYCRNPTEKDPAGEGERARVKIVTQGGLWSERKSGILQSNVHP